MHLSFFSSIKISVCLFTATIFCFQARANASSDGINDAGVFEKISVACYEFFAWFSAQPFDFQVQSLGALIAASSIASNWGALFALFQSVTSCKRTLDFTGRRMGRSDDFQKPMRALLLTFGFYAAYQIYSHMQGAVGSSSVFALYLDIGMQSFFVFLVGIQVFVIWRMAVDRWEDDKQRLRFWRVFNQALSESKVSLSQLAVGSAIMPIAAVSPKAVQAFAISDYGELFRKMLGALAV